MALTDTKIRTASAKEKAYKLQDGNGLYLEVRPTGSKSWRCRYYSNGKEGLFTIGKYPAVTKVEAIDYETPWDEHYTSANPQPGNGQLDLDVVDATTTLTFMPTFGSGRTARSETVYANLTTYGFNLDISNMFAASTGPLDPCYALRIILQAPDNQDMLLTINKGTPTHIIYLPNGSKMSTAQITIKKGTVYCAEFQNLASIGSILCTTLMSA